MLLAGHVPDIMGPKGPFAFIKWMQAHGSIYKLLFLDQFVVALLDTDAIAQVTRKTGMWIGAQQWHFWLAAMHCCCAVRLE